MKVELAKHAGYCYGVERAMSLTERAEANAPKPVQTLGPIIHNHQVVVELDSRGVVALATVAEAQEGTVILRTHGVEPDILAEAARRGLNIVDATCPFVKRAQARAAELFQEGYRVIILGERDHPEVKSHMAYAGAEALVVETEADFDKLPSGRRLGIVVQTTQSLEKLRRLVDYCLNLTNELKIHNTICGATARMQKAARELAERAGVMIVVGGKNSANTTHLAEICSEINKATYHIETEEDIQTDWFDQSCLLVGVAGGASTPVWILDKVVHRLEGLNPKDVANKRPNTQLSSGG